MIALLSNNIINVIHIQNLKSAQEIKNKKVHMFCVNNGVYNNDTKGNNRNLVLMDQLCVVTTDKTLVFFEFVGTSSFKFEEEKGQPDKGIPIAGGILPSQILWDNDLIYLATKKAYMILRKQDGSIVQ